MKRPHIIATALLGATLLMPVASLSAFGRDSDGSRMQARPLTFKASASDRLSPPNDAVDWRYVRLSDAHDVTLTVDSKPVGIAVEVTLTDAMGKTIARGRSSDGKYSTHRRLDPGLYYIAVSANRAVSYTLTVR